MFEIHPIFADIQVFIRKPIGYEETGRTINGNAITFPY